MNKIITPLKLEGVEESIYAGFWIRLVSLILEVVILIPYILLKLYVDGLGYSITYYTVLPELLFYFWFRIYLVKKYGGSPGKLIVGIKIIKLDGSDVTWREAILRELFSFLDTVFVSCIMVVALSYANKEIYMSLDWFKKQDYLLGLFPSLSRIHNVFNNFWFWSELVVLLFNKRKRAIHDYVAGTVIIKKTYLKKMRDLMQKEQVDLKTTTL